jgi:uncharacterized protein YwqG
MFSLFAPIASPIEETPAALKQLGKRCAYLRKGPSDSPSYFLGRPALPPGEAWPVYEGTPLDFLACLDLRQLHAVCALPWLPQEGALLFFYSRSTHPWGFDWKEKEAWRVLYVPDREGALETTTPEGIKELGSRPIHPSPGWSFPLALGPEIEAATREMLTEHIQKHHAAPLHQWGGYLQSSANDHQDLRMECELGRMGVFCGNGAHKAGPPAEEAKKHCGRWMPLLQIDHEIGPFEWQATGRLCFWVDLGHSAAALAR